MVAEKGLTEVVADRIGSYVKLQGGPELVAQLEEDAGLMKVPAARQGLEDMKLLLKYCELFGVLDKVGSDRECCFDSLCVLFPFC